MPLTCPACAREWADTATFCGHCGAVLAPSRLRGDDHASGPRRPRRALVVAGLVTLVVVAATVVPRVDLPTPFRAGIEDDGVALPSDVPAATDADDPDDPEESAPAGPIRCLHQDEPVDCIAWEVEVPGGTSLGPRRHVEDLLLHAPEEGGVVALDADTGDVRWARDDLAAARPVTRAGPVVVAHETTGTAFGLATTSGATQWQVTEAAVVMPTPTSSGHVVVGRGAALPEVDRIAALAPDTGEEVWDWTTPWAAPVRTARLTPDGSSLLVLGEDRMARVDTTTGETVYTVGVLPDAHPVVHASDHVVLEQMAEDGRVQVRDLETGTLVLEQDAGTVGERLVLDEVLLSDRPSGTPRLGAVDLATGTELWGREHHGARLGHVTSTADQPVLVLHETYEERVVRLAPRTGEELWRTPVPAPSGLTGGNATWIGAPQLVDDRVVLEDRDGVVTVLDVATGQELVQVDGGSQLDVRTLSPLTLVRGDQWVRIEVPPAG